MTLADYGVTAKLQMPYEEAVEKVRESLKEQGFGVLTEIDVKATLKEKLGIESEKYIILGACNPPFAHRAISSDPFVGLLLPCNVIVFEDNGETVVSAIDPISMLGGAGNPELDAVAKEVRPRLEKAVRNLE